MQEIIKPKCLNFLILLSFLNVYGYIVIDIPIGHSGLSFFEIISPFTSFVAAVFFACVAGGGFFIELVLLRSILSLRKDVTFLNSSSDSSSECYAIRGDLEERYNAILNAAGKFVASSWYTKQIITSLPPIIWAVMKKPLAALVRRIGSKASAID